MWKKIIRIVLSTTIIVVVVAAVVTLWAWRTVSMAQPWYEEVAAIEPTAAAEASRECRQQVNVARERLQDGLPWELIFTEDQINGWLAHEMGQPGNSIASESFRDPRVDILPGQIKIGGRYIGSGLDTVLSLSCKVSLTDKPNVASVYVDNVHAGQLTIPRGRAMDRIKKETDGRSLPLLWNEEEGQQCAFLFIPDELSHDLGPIRIDTFELLEGKIRIAGRSL